jgi:hypothetical protein
MPPPSEIASGRNYKGPESPAACADSAHFGFVIYYVTNVACGFWAGSGGDAEEASGELKIHQALPRGGGRPFALDDSGDPLEER